MPQVSTALGNMMMTIIIIIIINYSLAKLNYIQWNVAYLNVVYPNSGLPEQVTSC